MTSGIITHTVCNHLTPLMGCRCGARLHYGPDNGQPLPDSPSELANEETTYTVCSYAANAYARSHPWRSTSAIGSEHAPGCSVARMATLMADNFLSVLAGRGHV
jgi:hypothetical protein